MNSNRSQGVICMNIGSESAAIPEHMIDYNHKLLPLMKTWLKKTKKVIIIVTRSVIIDSEKEKKSGQLFFRIINLFRSLNFASKRFE